MLNCIACGTPLERPYIRGTFVGMPGSPLDGIPFEACARCLRFEPTQGRDVALPPRLSDPVAENLVAVFLAQDGSDWIAECRECGCTVGLKDNQDEAHLAAARHLARVHAGVAA